uniref:Uncharacterized protein n=1 Tax=Arundo donax TaxID=35708 RepID=A0A0A9H2E7_ARUDO
MPSAFNIIAVSSGVKGQSPSFLFAFESITFSFHHG